MSTQASSHCLVPCSSTHTHTHTHTHTQRGRATELKAVTIFKLEITTVLKLSQVALSLYCGSLKSHRVCVSILLCARRSAVCRCTGVVILIKVK